MVKSSESIENRKKRAKRVLRALKKLYPDTETALEHESPYELLVSTILSAQCTDDRVNMVTPTLFKKYPNPKKLAAAKTDDVEEIIRSTGFYRQKTKSIVGATKKIVEDYGGEVPGNMDDLLTLPGVARKTANCVLGSAFGINEGIVVDTHVGRLAERLALTWNAKNSKDAVKIEKDLMELFPRKDWTFIANALIDHGRAVCGARKPKCDECKLAKDCPSADTLDS